MQKQLSFFLLLFVLVGCHSKKNKNTIEDENLDKIETHSNDTNTSKIKESSIKTTGYFVTAKDGLIMRLKPIDNAKSLGKIEYGEKLNVVDERGNWLVIKKDITPSTKETIKTDTVFVQKQGTGAISDVQIAREELNLVSSFEYKGSQKQMANGFHLSDFLMLSFVDEPTYLQAMPKEKNGFLIDTLNYPKKKGTITLKLEKGTKKYSDRPNGGDDIVTYNYQGQYPILNAYIMLATYYENYNYILIDKKTGNEKTVFNEFPLLSSDHKYVVCIAENLYDETADLVMYEITNMSIKQVFKTSFMSWLPVNLGQNEVFWGVDNCIYIKALYPKICEVENGKEQGKYQYIKIKITEEDK